MAMRGLVETDCGGSNPLVRLTSHLTREQTKLEEVGARGGPAQEGLVREFLSETQHQVARRPPQTFRMDYLLREMREMERSETPLPQQAPPVSSMAWAAEYLENEVQGQGQREGQGPDSEQNVIDWSRQFLAEHRPALAGPDPLDSGVMTRNQQPRWAEEYLVDSLPVLNPTPPALERGEVEQFIQEVGREAKQGQRLASASETAWAEEFAEFSTDDLSSHVVNNNETFKQDFWKKLEDEWKEMSEEQDHPWLNEFSESYEPFSQYEFNPENVLAPHPDPLSEGKKRLEAGDLPSAVLLFEAAVKQEPDSVEAWQLLGTSQAENEQDPQAIAALKRCVGLDPGNLPALMALAVSYTNESYQAQACHALTQWIENNPAYRGLVVGDLQTNRGDKKHLNQATSFMSKKLHEDTAKMYIQAARQGTNIDPDVQAGLGVLFNLSGDFDKAVDCFSSAVSARPTDSLLWNRLGATLANGNRSEEAVAAYHTALRHSPGFIRCRYNLGISCINLKAYSEAAEHFLTALNFQDAGRGPQGKQSRMAMSDSIWSSLGLAVSFMKRPDLRPLLEARDLSSLSREFQVEPQTQL